MVNEALEQAWHCWINQRSSGLWAESQMISDKSKNFTLEAWLIDTL